jgi:tetratricopeptide (TPR) repeat protein
MFPRLVVPAVGLALIAFPDLHAQCPDGTPPPCEVRTARVAQRRVTAPPLDERGRSFLVLPFRNVTRSPDHDWLVEGATTLLSDALGQWEEISVVPAGRLYPALRRHDLEPGQVMDEAGVKQVAEETGGWTAVTGDVLVTGSRIRLSARAYDVVSNEVVVRATENAQGEDDILPAFERLAGQLLATAGLDVEEADLAGMTTQSLDAYQAYVRGLGHYHRNEVVQASEAFREAVALDSTFALAHLKLAESLMSSGEGLFDPEGEGHRHAARAATLSQHLRLRDREFVQAIAALFRAQIAEAREGLSRILTADSNDLEALENLAEIEAFDPVLIPAGVGERPRGSLNEAARLSKRALALDPGRHQNLETLVGVYMTAGGAGELGYGRVPAIRGEPASLLALFQQLGQNPAGMYVAVLRDTIELVPADSLDAIEPDTLAAARRRALQAAVAWVQQWLTATPDAAYTNLEASEVYALAGAYDEALSHLARADSLGLEVEYLQNIEGRRLRILVRAGRHEEALALADSLFGAGYFDVAALGPMQRQLDLGWAYQEYLLSGRPAAAESTVVQQRGLLGQLAPTVSEEQRGFIALRAFALRSWAGGPLFLPEIPEEIRFAAADSLAAHLDRVPVGDVLDAQLINAFQLVLVGLPPERTTEIAEVWRSTARRWVDTERADLAMKIVPALVNADTSETGRDATQTLLREILDREPELWAAHYQLGKLGAVSGRYLDEAETALKRFIEDAPETVEYGEASAYWRLGMVYEHKSDAVAARAAYEEALRLEPEHPQATAAIQRLEGGDGLE